MAQISSPSPSDSPKVDCNVVGAFLEKRPKFKLLQNFSDFFFFFHLFLLTLLSQESARVGFYIIPLCLGQGLYKWLQKEAKTKNKMEDKIQLQTPCGFVV